MVFYGKTHIKVIRYKDMGWIRVARVWFSGGLLWKVQKTFSTPIKADLHLLVEKLVASQEGKLFSRYVLQPVQKWSKH